MTAAASSNGSTRLAVGENGVLDADTGKQRAGVVPGIDMSMSRRILAAETWLPDNKTTCLVLLGTLLLAGAGSAQPVSASGSKYYIWGQVVSPGTYSFVANPDLLELLSAAGGPTQDANLKRVVLIRMITQKRTRIDLQSLLNKGQVVRLSPGDVVLVPASPWYNMREVLTYVTFVVSTATLVFTALNWGGGLN